MAPEPDAPQPVDGRRARGDRTRGSALAEAVQLASVDGLEGLSIARLAARLGTAKSTVHATFGSKVSLQVAVIGAVREILIGLVVARAREAPAGCQRLAALGEGWMSYLESETFEGGCLLSSASAEMDGRPGAARDAVAAAMSEWLALLAGNARIAIKAGEIDPAVDPEQLAFELNAIGMAANWHFQLFGGAEAFRAGRAAWANILNSNRA
jgi:AcrR family transcriptional regulator